MQEESSPKKLLITIDHASTGGCQEVVKTWLTYLDKSLFKTLVVVLHGDGEYLQLFKDCDVDAISLSKSKANPFLIFKLYSIIKNFKPDIVHNNLVISSILGPLFSSFLNINKIITHTHSEMPLRGKYKFLKILYSMGVRKSHNVIAVSDKVKENLIKIYNIPESLINVIPNTYNINLSKINPQHLIDFKKKYNLPEDAFICGTAGTLIYFKNHLLAMKAIKALSDHHPNLYLFIAGDGPDKEKLSLYIEENHLQKRVFLLGRIAHDGSDFLNYNTFIHSLDTFILSSTIEGFPLVALEAMYAKRFVIASEVSGIKNVFCDKKEILTYEIDNLEQLTECLKLRIKMNKNESHSMIEAANDKVIAQFGPQNVFSRIASLYK